jgi:CheY-like chemotaxis protein
MRELETRDDRDVIQPGDRILLIVEDDPGFAKILLDLAREKGFRGIVARRGALALELAHSHKPDAITLDIHIPDMDGWTVLDVLKSDPGLRHIPVDVISVEDNSLRGLSHGAFQFLCKPVSRSQLDTAMETTIKFLDRPVKNLLLVISGKDELKEITALLGNGDIAVQSAASGKAGLAAMRKKSYDCVVAGAALADMSGATFIATLREGRLLTGVPVVVYSNAPLADAERAALAELAATSVVTSAESPVRVCSIRPLCFCTARCRACRRKSANCSSNSSRRRPISAARKS